MARSAAHATSSVPADTAARSRGANRASTSSKRPSRSAYLGRDNASPADDLVGYRQHAIWLSHDELTGLISELRDAILPVLANSPRGDRARYLLSPILFPIEDPPADQP